MSGAFADFAMPKQKKVRQKPRRRTRISIVGPKLQDVSTPKDAGKYYNMTSQTRGLLEQGISLMEKHGWTSTRAARELGLRAKYISNRICKRKPDDPLVLRYRACDANPRNRLVLRRNNAIKCIKLMEDKGVDAKAASRQIGQVDHYLANSIFEMAEDDPLRIRYRNIQRDRLGDKFYE